MKSLTPFQESALGRAIALGISERGFHELGQDQLELLWKDQTLGPESRAQQIHLFAARHGWDVAIKNRASSAMFRKVDTKVRIAALWRRLSHERLAQDPVRSEPSAVNLGQDRTRESRCV